MTHLQLLSDNTVEAMIGGFNIGSITGTYAFSGFASRGTAKTNISGGNNTNFNTGFIQIAEFNYYS